MPQNNRSIQENDIRKLFENLGGQVAICSEDCQDPFSAEIEAKGLVTSLIASIKETNNAEVNASQLYIAHRMVSNSDQHFGIITKLPNSYFGYVGWRPIANNEAGKGSTPIAPSTMPPSEKTIPASTV